MLKRLLKKITLKHLAIFTGLFLVGIGCLLYSMRGYFHLFRRPAPRGKTVATRKTSAVKQKKQRKVTLKDKADYQLEFYPMIEMDQGVAVSIRPLFGVLEEKESLFDMGYENYNFTQKPSVKEKEKFVEQLGNELTVDERQSLYYFIAEEENTAENLFIKDDIMEKLEDQKIYPPEYVSALISFSLNEKIDGDLRGYTVQHLRSAYERADEYERDRIREALFTVTEDRNTDTSGTAILALAELSRKYDEFDLERINSTALSLATDPGLYTPSRITAVNVCGILKNEESAQELRALIEEPCDITLKIAAVGAIGEIGSKEDILALQKIGKERIYKVAAQVAVKKILDREQ